MNFNSYVNLSRCVFVTESDVHPDFEPLCRQRTVEHFAEAAGEEWGPGGCAPGVPPTERTWQRRALPSRG